MMSDRELMRTLTIEHLDGEGDFLLCAADECHVGEDD
jgi:hypothetical protein